MTETNGGNIPLISFTLDTNCIIDVDDNREQAPFVRQLVAAHEAGKADVALVQASASERQQGDKFIENYADFVQKAEELGFGKLPQLSIVNAYGVGFWGCGYVGGKRGWIVREGEIHTALFPNIERNFQAFRKVNEAPDDLRHKDNKKWRNASCDTKMFWAHDHNQRDHFVTSDKNFKKNAGGQPEIP